MFLPQIRAGTAVLVPIQITKGQPPTLYDPSSTPIIFIQDPDGVIQINGVVMTRLSTGSYQYTYSTPSGGVLGDWVVWINATDSGVLSGSLKTPSFTLTVP
jgi:hypothetical protein